MECFDSDQEAMDTAMDSEGGSFDVDQQGSCSAKKGSCSSQKGTKKRKVGSNDATKHILITCGVCVILHNSAKGDQRS